MTTAADYYNTYQQYGSLSSYFGQGGGTGSPGKAGGAGYNNDATLTSGSGSSGDQQSPSASSGSGWISAAASTSTSDKSAFSTPFQQSFGGIANNQVYVIDSPNSGVTSTPAFSPVLGPPVPSNTFPGSSSPTSTIVLAIIAAIAGALALKFLR